MLGFRRKACLFRPLRPLERPTALRLLLLVAEGAGDMAAGDVPKVSAGPRLMPPEG